MKKILSLIAVIALCATAHAGNYVTLLTGTGGTNATSLVGLTNYQQGVVFAAWTNAYNLQINGGSQGNLGGGQQNTNLWPAASFSPQGNYPNTLYGPFRNTAIFTQLPLTATNAVAATIIVRYAGSVDGNNWVSNVVVQTFNPIANTASAANNLTNYDSTSYPYIALQAIENNAAVPITNALIEVSGKPGL